MEASPYPCIFNQMFSKSNTSLIRTDSERMKILAKIVQVVCHGRNTVARLSYRYLLKYFYLTLLGQRNVGIVSLAKFSKMGSFLKAYEPR